jgi:dipeptidase E
MGMVVAIGGGQIGRPGTDIPVETAEIDSEIIRLSGKNQPKLLFVPTAASDAESYCDAVRQHFGGRMGCTVDILYLINDPQTRNEVEKKVLSADIIYVGGGNTLKMLILIPGRQYSTTGVKNAGRMNRTWYLIGYTQEKVEPKSKGTCWLCR